MYKILSKRNPFLICFMVLCMHPALISGVVSQQFWTSMPEYTGGPKTGITLAGDSCLIVGCTTGIMRSCDSGKTFESVLTAPAIFSVYACKAGKVYAGGAGTIYLSEDLGKSWDSIALQSSFPVVQIIENHQGHILAITGALDVDLGYVGDGVFYSDNHGKSWTNRNNGLGIYKSCEKIAVDRNGRLYLAMADEYVTGNGGLFISENNGLLWEHINISIDGKNTVPDNIKVGNTFGLSVSPEDSVYLSITGTAVNAFVRLNLKKSINDIRNSSFWRSYRVFNSVSWWLDRVLNNIHFAKNGDWYSSTRGSINTGVTYFSRDKGNSWNMVYYGLGLDIYGFRNIQHFAEDKNGKIFMVQLLDERVYSSTASPVTNIKQPGIDQHIRIFPNPAIGGEKVSIHLSTEAGNKEIFVLDLFGRKISSQSVSGSLLEISAPQQPGHYLLMINSKRFRGKYCLIVQ